MGDFSRSKKAKKQFSSKNKTLDKIAERLNIPRAITQLKARGMVVNAIKTHDEHGQANQPEIMEVLRRMNAGGPTQWAQFSPWLAGEKDWAKC